MRSPAHKVMRPIYQSALRFFFSSYANIFSRPIFYKFNYLLYETALHGMGYLNYFSSVNSGEKPFLRRLDSFYAAHLSAGDGNIVVFDVGAHHGSYSVDVLHTLPSRPIQLHCFEPSPVSFACLTQALYGYPNIELNNIGLANASSTSKLYDYHDNPGSEHASLVPANLGKSESHASFVVQLSTGDEYMKQKHIDKVHFLKLDCEGYELKVLQGFSDAIAAGKIDFVQFEFNSTMLSDRLLLSDFARQLVGFRFYRLMPHGLHQIDVSAPPLYLYQNIVAISPHISAFNPC